MKFCGTFIHLGGHVVISGGINLVIHVVMYFYYLLTVINPELKDSIWWKKYLTQIQIVSELIIFFKNHLKVSVEIKFNSILDAIWLQYLSHWTAIAHVSWMRIPKVLAAYILHGKYVFVIFILKFLHKKLHCQTKNFE